MGQGGPLAGCDDGLEGGVLGAAAAHLILEFGGDFGLRDTSLDPLDRGLEGLGIEQHGSSNLLNLFGGFDGSQLLDRGGYWLQGSSHGELVLEGLVAIESEAGLLESDSLPLLALNEP